MNQTISHSGIIQQILHDSIVVNIVSQTACSSCHAKGACGVSDEKEIQIHVPITTPTKYSIGQHVTVNISEKTAFNAVLLAYIVPFGIIFFILLITNYFFSEPIAVAITFSCLALYYIILSRNKASIHKNIQFHIAHTI